MNMLFKGVFGSHLYSLNTETSDKDYKGIYMPKPREIILGKTKKNITHSTGDSVGKNTSDDVDTEIFSLQEFVKLACQGQTVAIDMLHTPDNLTLEDSPQWQYLVHNRHKFYSKNMNAFMGYVKKQAAKYGVKGSKVKVLEDLLTLLDQTLAFYPEYTQIRQFTNLFPTTEYSHWESDPENDQLFYILNGSKNHSVITVQEFRGRVQKQYDNYGARAKQAASNEGIDWKAISHALRAGYQLRHIFTSGDFSYPLPETDYILAVKKGEKDYMSEVSPVLESLVEEIESLSLNSNLPEKVDVDFWDSWVYTQYQSNILTNS